MCIVVRWEKSFATFQSSMIYLFASTATIINSKRNFVVLRVVSFCVLPVQSVNRVVVDVRKRFLFDNICENKKRVFFQHTKNLLSFMSFKYDVKTIETMAIFRKRQIFPKSEPSY